MPTHSKRCDSSRTVWAALYSDLPNRREVLASLSAKLRAAISRSDPTAGLRHDIARAAARVQEAERAGQLLRDTASIGTIRYLRELRLRLQEVDDSPLCRISSVTCEQSSRAKKRVYFNLNKKEITK